MTKSGEYRQAKTIMLQGTASDVGKSLLTAGLCRIFKQDGRKVAPFKSQNMSLNSYVTADGKEIGRAQGMQADACGITATTDMNPILLKPKKDMVSQVVVHGKPYRDLTARAYREQYLPQAEEIVKRSLHRLREAYDVVVIEGAGSPAEVNLKDRDIVNMRLAAWADAPVILVADIDRGGVFASIVGTMEILEPAERERICGIIINKFRGDRSLLQPGIVWLEERIGKPVLGVVPYLEQLSLEDEDSASLDNKRSAVHTHGHAMNQADRQIDVAVIRLPRLSNFTDFDPLLAEPDVHVRYIDSVKEWGNPDVVFLPGSKNTMEDLLFIKETGFADQLRTYVAGGGRLTGICAGYQMMGQSLLDPHQIESDRSHLTGLGLFPMETIFTPDKRTEQIVGHATADFIAATGLKLLEFPVSGYELHMGRTSFLRPVVHPFRIRQLKLSQGMSVHNPQSSAILNDRYPSEGDNSDSKYHLDGVISNDGRLWGTYIHGILQQDAFRQAWLNKIRMDKGMPIPANTVSYKLLREQSFDRLADHVRQHVNMDRINRIIDGYDSN